MEKMKIEDIDITRIVPYENNNRVHSEEQIRRMANSIKSFGFNQPLVIDEESIVIVGHGRLLAAQELGLKEIPCYKIKGLTEAQKRAYRILDNKLQNDSSWDWNTLSAELKFLEEENFDLPDWGLDELQKFLEEDIVVEDDEFDSDSLPDICLIKENDIIKLNQHTLICADSSAFLLDSMGVNPITIDMIITDPPYGVSYKGKTSDELEIKNDNLSEAELSDLWTATLDNVLTFLKNGGALYASVPSGPLKTIFMNALKDRGILRQELIWLKDSMVMGHSDYHYKHESILYGWKPGASHFITPSRDKVSVLEFDRPKQSKEHPTKKPVPLWAELISNSTIKGETVLDPFAGSGTTLIACESLNRTSYNIEIDPKYCQVIIDRYYNYCCNNNINCEISINGKPFTPAR